MSGLTNFSAALNDVSRQQAITTSVGLFGSQVLGDSYQVAINIIRSVSAQELRLAHTTVDRILTVPC